MSHSGATIHCMIHNADTRVGATERSVPEHFTVGCVYCMHEEILQLAKDYAKVRKERDTLVDAMSIVKMVKSE